MKQFRQLFLFLLILILSDCKKRPTFPASPEITFLGINKVKIIDKENKTPKDSITISLAFKDGDGDLGAYGTSNYFAELFVKKDGIFTQILEKDTIPDIFINKNGTFPPLNPDGRQGPIEGELNYAVSIELLKTFGNSASFVAKFKVYIKDNAGNSSNTIETSEVTIRNYQIPEEEVVAVDN